MANPVNRWTTIVNSGWVKYVVHGWATWSATNGYVWLRVAIYRSVGGIYNGAVGTIPGVGGTVLGTFFVITLSLYIFVAAVLVEIGVRFTVFLFALTLIAVVLHPLSVVCFLGS